MPDGASGSSTTSGIVSRSWKEPRRATSSLCSRLTELEGDDDRIAGLADEEARLAATVAELAGRLTELRRAAADSFAARVTAELTALAMPHARLAVAVIPADDFGRRYVTFALVGAVSTVISLVLFLALRGPAFDLGGRILNLVRQLGLGAIEVTAAAHVWSRWNPDTEVAPPGLFPIRTIIDQLGELRYLEDDMAERFVIDVENAARRDRLCISLCMLAVFGHRPG